MMQRKATQLIKAVAINNGVFIAATDIMQSEYVVETIKHAYYKGNEENMEQGGFIYCNLNDIQKYQIVPASRGASSSGIVLTPLPKAPQGYILVGDFHTHPCGKSKMEKSASARPSKVDIAHASDKPYHMFVAHFKYEYKNPPSDRGKWTQFDFGDFIISHID